MQAWAGGRALQIGTIMSALRPGNKAPISGQYLEVGPRGGNVGTHEVTSTKNNPLPPTQVAGRTYKPVDGTNNKSGGRK